MPMLLSDPDRSSLRPWCDPESATVCVGIDDTLSQVIAQFRARPGLRILPVVDAAQQVRGAIFEADVRQILFNPYGHALLQNPGIGRRLHRLMKPCPMVEADASPAAAIRACAGVPDREGLILVDDGRLAGVLPIHMLVRLAAADDAARLDRITTLGLRFEAEAADLTRLLDRVANDIQQASATAARHAAGCIARTAVVADAGRLGTTAIDRLAGESRALAAAFDQLNADTAHVHDVSLRAVDAVRHGTIQIDRLTMAARSIESMLVLIHALAKRLNLLSLNATIEAARAGEAGLGFTVVANEVRTLSGQTRKAADRITGEIQSILTAVCDVAEGQAAMRTVVTSVDDLVESVEATVAARRIMSDRIADQAETAQAMAVALEGLLDGMNDESRIAQSGANDMERLAGILSSNATQFGAAVGGFLADMQSA